MSALAMNGDGSRSVRDALKFSMVIMLLSLVGQRFGLVSGHSALSFVGPIGLAVIGWSFFTGLLAFDRTRLMIWLAMLIWIVIDATVRAADPSPVGHDTSAASMAQFVIINGFAVFSFAKPVGERAFFRAINWCFGFVAVAGLVQFAVQFAGLSLFEFSKILPSKVLIESFFNVAIPISGSKFFKSNGFFLLEPSIFSQFMALALLIEIMVLRRTSYLALFAAGMLVSVSGTGWMMIGAFVLTVMVSMGRRGIGLAAATAALGLFALLCLYFLAPSIFAVLQDRINEFQMPGTSGHLRFVTPWWAASDMLSMDPLGWIFGVGAGISEHPSRYVNYEYNMNPPAKLLIEYGLPVLGLYLMLLVSGAKSAVQRALLVPVLVLILLDGGYQQTPFILFPAMLICLVATLKQDDKIGMQQSVLSSGSVMAASATTS